MRENLGHDIIIHIVGTKTDLIAQNPSLRKIPFERCIAYVADNLYPASIPTYPISLSDRSNRSSGFWAQEVGWDCCHEISASSGEGIEEVFRVITRKLVEQKNKAAEREHSKNPMGSESSEGALFEGFAETRQAATGSFRVGTGDKRRSWLLQRPSVGISEETYAGAGEESMNRNRKCC